MFKPLTQKDAMLPSIPTVFIPALLCDERLYSGVIAALGPKIDARVMM